MIEIQKGSEMAERMVLRTMERAMKDLLSLYWSARAKVVMASGMAASMIELENVAGEWPMAV